MSLSSHTNYKHELTFTLIGSISNNVYILEALRIFIFNCQLNPHRLQNKTMTTVSWNYSHDCKSVVEESERIKSLQYIHSIWHQRNITTKIYDKLILNFVSVCVCNLFSLLMLTTKTVNVKFKLINYSLKRNKNDHHQKNIHYIPNLNLVTNITKLIQSQPCLIYILYSIHQYIFSKITKSTLSVTN